jgi:hypothetical protein
MILAVFERREALVTTTHKRQGIGLLDPFWRFALQKCLDMGKQ